MRWSLLILLCAFHVLVNAQSLRDLANYDENAVPKYTLPPLETSLKAWERKRGEIIGYFENEVYGRFPGGQFELDFQVAKEWGKAVEGRANVKEVTLRITTAKGELPIYVLLFTPVEANGPVPVFLGINFYGNHSVHKDTAITLSRQWMRKKEGYGIVDHRATENSRAVRAYRWDIDHILNRGYGLATFYYGDLDPDFDDGFQNGVHPLFYADGQSAPKPNEWGAIGAWAWGARRVMDYLETEPYVDAEKVLLFGHSRLGKTALWAGALDQRFAAIISNNSGNGGATLFRRRFGETVKLINGIFPHWYCENFKKYDDKEHELPVDQHQLIALIAPRPVYVASASQDLWADPKGEFLAAKEASKIYKLYGKKGLEIEGMPETNQPLLGHVSYHLRLGKHDVTDYDWERYLDFADYHFKPKKNNQPRNSACKKT